MTIQLNMRDIRDYERFLKVRRLPLYRFVGENAVVPERYAVAIDGAATVVPDAEWKAPAWMGVRWRSRTTN